MPKPMPKAARPGTTSHAGASRSAFLRAHLLPQWPGQGGQQREPEALHHQQGQFDAQLREEKAQGFQQAAGRLQEFADAVRVVHGEPEMARIVRRRDAAGERRAPEPDTGARGASALGPTIWFHPLTSPSPGVDSMSVLNRRRALHWLGASSLALAGQAQAQSGKAVRLLVGFPPGGGTDAIARLLAERLKDELGTPVIVENKSGAGGQLAAQALKAAAPDGSTYFLTHDHTVSILPLVVKSAGFDTAHDFTPVAGFASFANALALSGGTPARSLADYVAWVKGAGGGKGAVGVPAAASVPEFLVKVLAEKFQLDLVSAPYRGSAPMMADMLGNQIAAGIASIPDFIENHRSGKLRIVAVMGAARQAALPEVPTLAEAGLAGFEELPFYGFFAPAGTPRAVLDPFAAAVAKVIALPELRERLVAMGLSVGFMNPGQFGARERAYSASWARIIKASGFQPQ
jgi:tripartite-type tricarboxylate transporter receptor subunit TctC